MAEALRAGRRLVLLPGRGGFGGRRLVIRTAASNKAARRAAESAGFQLRGLDRAAFALGDKTVDDRAVYDLLATDD